MATFAIAPPLPVRTTQTGPVESYVAGGRIAFGAAVIRAGAGTVKTAILEDTDLIIGFALEDEEEHTYPGFYESGEVVPVAVGGVVRGMVAAIDDYDLLAYDFLEHIDITSGTMASGVGVLAEAGTHLGETRTIHSVARLLEDCALKDETYKAPSTTPTAAETTISMTAGDMTIMGLSVGDYIIIRDSDGTTAQINRITAMSDDGSTATMTVLIPISVAAADYIHAVRRPKILILQH